MPYQNNESMQFDVLVDVSRSSAQMTEKASIPELPVFSSENAQGALRMVASHDEIRQLGIASAQRVVKAFGKAAK